MSDQFQDTSGTSKSYLSCRGQRNLELFQLRTRRQTKQYSDNNDLKKIDLSTADNSLIRLELLEICKIGMSNALKSENMSTSPGFSGSPALRDAFSATMNTYFKPAKAVDQSHVIIGPGGAHCITALLYNICNEGDGVLIPAPYWHGFDFHCRLAPGVVPIPAAVPNLDTALSEQSLLPALKDAFEKSVYSIKALLLTNPHNPLGQRYTRETLETILRFCSEKNLHLISDEVYALTSIPYDGQQGEPFNSLLSIDLELSTLARSMVHVVWSLSKDFGLASIKMGCTITQYNPNLVDCLRVTNHMHTSSLSCATSTALLTSSDLPKLLKLNSERLGEAYKTLIALFENYNIPYIKSVACPFVFAKIAPEASCLEDETQMIDSFRKIGVLLSSGSQYHLPEREYGWARVGFAIDRADFKEGLRRMEAVLRHRGSK